MVMSSILLFAVSAFADAPKAINEIVYARVGNRALHMNLTLPSSNTDKPRPAVLWFHGGGWIMGDYHDDWSAEYGLAQAGFVTGSVEYRFSSESIYPAQIWDCKAAIRFLRANASKYGSDPNRIGVWGASAGGHLVALLGTTGGVKQLEGDEGNLGYSSRVQAVCDLFGPTDINPVTMRDFTPMVVDQVTKLVGGSVSENQGLARLASPLEFVSKGDAPTLILHGEDDPLVPISHSEKLYDALKRCGVDVTFVRVKHAGHGFGDKENDPSYPELKKMIVDFFTKHLDNK